MCGECAPRWGRLSPQIGRTPLQWASAHGHVDIVRLLLDRGASMEATVVVSQPACLAAPPSTLHRGSWHHILRYNRPRPRRTQRGRVTWPGGWRARTTSPSVCMGSTCGDPGARIVCLLNSRHSRVA